MKQTQHFILMAVFIAFWVALTTNVHAGPSAKRDGSGRFTTGGGQEGTYEWNMQRSGKTATRQQSVTTGGKTYNRSTVTTVDPQSGTVDRTITAPGGQTHTTSGSVTWGGDGSATFDGTGRRGRQRSVTIDPN